MRHVWWRTHLRALPELGALARFGDFAEVDGFVPYLIGALDLPAGGTLVELGCGRGSFLVRVAEWGYQVTGVEDSEPMLAEARLAAARRGITVALRTGSRITLAERNHFDGAVILDYGTLSDSENAEQLRCTVAALRPGGRMAFSCCNPHYWARPAEMEHRIVEGVDVLRRWGFDFDGGAVTSRVRCIFPDGRRQELAPARYRAYTLPELRTLIAAVGLADLAMCGEDAQGNPLPGRRPEPLQTPFFHCVALKPAGGEGGEGI